MKLQVSKTFAKYINTLNKKGLIHIDNCSVVEFTERSYIVHVPNNRLFNEMYIDYNPKTDKYKALCIVYPSKFNAMPLYLTTIILLNEFKRRNVKTVEQFHNMLVDLIEA